MLKIIHKYKLENEYMMLCVPAGAPRKQMVPLPEHALLSSPFSKTAIALAPKHTKATMSHWQCVQYEFIRITH